MPTTTASLSRLENGIQPYSPAILEALADVLNTDPGALITRDPADGDPIWQIWDHANEGEKEQIERLAEAIIGYRAPPLDDKKL